MIQANELRIGNLLQWQNAAWPDDTCEIVQVTEIKLEKEMSGKEYYAVSFVDPFGNKENAGTAFLDEFIPIPITPERLERFGFVEEYENEYWKNYDVDGITEYFELFYHQHGSIHHQGENIGNDLHYIHQLQNRYYSLTGTELEMKQL